MKRLFSRLLARYATAPFHVRVAVLAAIVLKYLLVGWLVMKGASGFPLHASPSMPTVGVVSWDLLRKGHPAWGGVETIEAEIARLGQRIAEESRRTFRPESAVLTRLVTAVTAPPPPFSTPDQDRLAETALARSAMLLAAADFESLLSAVDQRVRKLVDVQRRSLEETFQAFSQQAVEEGEKRFQAKREALEEKALDEFREREGALKQELLDYQGKVLKQNQDEKLNLQLKLVVTRNPEERARLETRLNHLTGDEEILMEGKQREHQEILDALKKEKEAGITEELKRERDSIAAEIKARLSKRKEELRKAFGSFLRQRTTLTGGTVEALKRRLLEPPSKEKHPPPAPPRKDRGSSLRSFSRLKASTEARLDAERATVRRKARELAATLENEAEARLEGLRVQLRTLEEQRERLLRRIDRDLDDHLALVALARGLKLVLRDPLAAGSAVDLTEAVLAGLKASPH